MSELQERILSKIKEALNPEELELINESHKHRGHAGDNGSGESHFKLKVVSSAFDGMSPLVKQRLVLEVIHEEIKEIHALSMTLKSSQK